MARYSFTFRKSSTGRVNKGQGRAKDEAELRVQLASRPDVAEILSVERLPDPPATERQLEYLHDLGVAFPASLSLAEASDLIDNAQKRRSPGSEHDRKLAEYYQVEVTQYASKASIFRAILADLREREDLSHLAQWYVYRVYRNGFDRRDGGGIMDPRNDVITAIASQLLADSAALRSLRREASSSITQFRWFGDLHQGYTVMSGDSNRTAAYGFAAERLKDAGLLSAIRPRAFSFKEPDRRTAKRDVATNSEDFEGGLAKASGGGICGWVALAVLAASLYACVG